MTSQSGPIRTALFAGVLVPFLYFGAQLAAIPFYPGYDVVRQSASELGSDRSDRPAVLNTGAAATGIATLIAAFGFLAALKGRLRWLLFLAVISAGVGAFWAAWFPLPDPRHNSGAIGAGAFLLPVLFAATMWKTPLKRYLLVNALLFVALIPIMSGATGLPIVQYRGVLQRIAAAVLYLPIGVTAFWLRR